MDEQTGCILVPQSWIEINKAFQELGEKEYEKLVDLFLYENTNIFSEKILEIADKLVDKISFLEGIERNVARAFVVGALLCGVFDGHVMHEFLAREFSSAVLKAVLAVQAEENEKNPGSVH